MYAETRQIAYASALRIARAGTREGGLGLAILSPLTRTLTDVADGAVVRGSLDPRQAMDRQA